MTADLRMTFSSGHFRAVDNADEAAPLSNILFLKHLDRDSAVSSIISGVFEPSGFGRQAGG